MLTLREGTQPVIGRRGKVLPQSPSVGGDLIARRGEVSSWSRARPGAVGAAWAAAPSPVRPLTPRSAPSRSEPGGLANHCIARELLARPRLLPETAPRPLNAVEPRIWSKTSRFLQGVAD